VRGFPSFQEGKGISRHHAIFTESIKEGKMTRGKLPEHYEVIKRENKKFFSALERLGKVAREEGPLDEKTVQLIQLAAAVAIRSEGAVHSHARRALAAGAEVGEIRHSITVLATTIGFPTVAAALNWINDLSE